MSVPREGTAAPKVAGNRLQQSVASVNGRCHSARNLICCTALCRLLATFATLRDRGWIPLSGGMCCKTIVMTRMSNIDSRTRISAQRRFKNIVHLDSIIAHSQRSKEFCNTIRGRTVMQRTHRNDRFCPFGTSPPFKRGPKTPKLV